MPFLLIFSQPLFISHATEVIFYCTFAVALHIGCNYFEITQIYLVFLMDFSFKTEFCCLSRTRLWFWMHFCGQS